MGNHFGSLLSATGGALTLLFPIGLLSFGLIPFSFSTLRTSLLLTAPFLLSVVLLRICIRLQQSGVREYSKIPQPMRSFVWAINRYSLWPTIAHYRLLHSLGNRSYYDVIKGGSEGGGEGKKGNEAKLIVGGAPWEGLINELALKHQIGAVLNCTAETSGPVALYRKLGISQLRLHCEDYCDVPEHSIRNGAAFIHEHMSNGRSVYVHCKAGRGRAVTLAVAYIAMWVTGRDLEAANRLVKQSRPSAIRVCHRPDLVRFAQGEMAEIVS